MEYKEYHIRSGQVWFCCQLSYSETVWIEFWVSELWVMDWGAAPILSVWCNCRPGKFCTRPWASLDLPPVTLSWSLFLPPICSLTTLLMSLLCPHISGVLPFTVPSVHMISSHIFLKSQNDCRRHVIVIYLVLSLGSNHFSFFWTTFSAGDTVGESVMWRGHRGGGIRPSGWMPWRGVQVWAWKKLSNLGLQRGCRLIQGLL